MDQQSQTRMEQWLKKSELEEIQSRIEDKPHGHIPNDSKSEDEQWFLGFNEKGREVFLKDVRVFAQNMGNRNENVEFGFRIKEELLEDKKEMLKNMSEIRKLDRTRLLCLRKFEKGKLLTKVWKENVLLKKIESKDVMEDNELLYLGSSEETALLKKKTGKSS